jgi:hypothetical protein
MDIEGFQARLLLVIFLSGVALMGIPRTASAQSGDRAISESARQDYEAGVEHYENQRYDAAASAFRRAYALTPAPILLYNISLAEWRSGNIDDAKTAALRASQGDVPDEIRTKLQAKLAGYDVIEQTGRMVGGLPSQRPESPQSKSANPNDSHAPSATKPTPTPSEATMVEPAYGALFWSGVGLATLSAASLTAGFVIDQQIGRDADKMGRPGGRSDTEILADIEQNQRLGAPLLIAGGLGLVSGLTMIVFDLPANEEATVDQVSGWQVKPTAGVDRVGLNVGHSF